MQHGSTQDYLDPPVAGENKHVGFGVNDEQKNKEWVAKIAEAMSHQIWTPEKGANEGIPAGFTYFGQLVAHDLGIHAVEKDPNTGPVLLNPGNPILRHGLTLNTIYGAGPLITPLPYRLNADGGRDSLKLGQVRTAGEQGNAGIKETNAWSDIPRLGCPYAHTMGQAEESNGFADVLIADSRNDDNLILSQLVVALHKLHNWIVGKLASKIDDPITRFETAAKIVAFLYRRVLVRDYLDRLLHPEILKLYDKETFTCAENIDFRSSQSDISQEFLAAAFRFGHAAILPLYRINKKLINSNNNPLHVSVSDVLDRSSHREPRNMPVEDTWVIEWPFFFDIDGKQRPQPSHKIGPSYRETILDTEGRNPEGVVTAGQPGLNLAQVDLLRGLNAQKLRKVSRLAELLPEHIRDMSPHLDAQGRGAMVTEWLKKIPSSAEAFSPAEVQMTIDDMPPMLFVLLEAHNTAFGQTNDEREKSRGTRLGILGSAIVADTIFRVLRRSHSKIEGDEEIVDSAKDLVSGAQDGRIGTLLGLVS